MNQKEYIKKRLGTYSKLGLPESEIIEVLNRYGYTDCKVKSNDDDLLSIECTGVMTEPNPKFVDDINSVVGDSIYWEEVPSYNKENTSIFEFYKDEETYSKKMYSKSLDEARSELISMVDEVDYDEEFADKIKDKIKSSDRDALISMLDEEIKLGEGSKDWKKSIEKFKSIRAKLSTNSLDHTPIDLKEIDNFMVTKFPQYRCTSNNYDDFRKYEDWKRVIGISLDRKRKDKFTVTSWYGDDLKGIVEIKGKGINDLKTTLTTQAEKLKTYSAWPFILKALGGAVIGQLVAKAFNRAKFKQPSNKELFDATLKKFEKAKTPEDAEKYYKMLIGQLNDSENKEEVKQYISEVKEEAESKM